MQPFPKPMPSTGLHASSSPNLPHELSLWTERALGAGGTRRAASGGDWPNAATEARDALLRALAHRFFPWIPVSTQAARLYALAETYAFVNWPRDKDCAEIPARYAGTPDEYLWAAFKSGAPMTLPLREFRRILLSAPEKEI